MKIPNNYYNIFNQSPGFDYFIADILERFFKDAEEAEMTKDELKHYFLVMLFS